MGSEEARVRLPLRSRLLLRLLLVLLLVRWREREKMTRRRTWIPLPTTAGFLCPCTYE